MVPFFILVLLNQQHCPKPLVSWCMMLFKHILGYCAKTSPLWILKPCLNYQLSQNTYWDLSQATLIWILSSCCLGSSILSSWEPGWWDGRLRSAPNPGNKQVSFKPQRNQWEGLGGQLSFWLRSRDTRKITNSTERNSLANFGGLFLLSFKRNKYMVFVTNLSELFVFPISCVIAMCLCDEGRVYRFKISFSV